MTVNLTNGPLMLRNDGAVFTNIPFHPYTTDGPDYTIEYVEWMYNSTNSQVLRTKIVQFLSALCVEELDGQLNLNLLYEYFEAPAPSVTFMNEVTPLLEENSFLSSLKLNDEIGAMINQEFIRARVGGRYDTSVEKDKEIVFRVASQEVNWFEIIRKFILDNKDQLEFITIIHDKETFGFDDCYDYQDIKFDKLPVDEFLSIEGIPLIEEVVVKW